MSNSVKIIVGVCLLAFTAACETKKEVVYVEPVVAEPVYSKY